MTFSVTGFIFCDDIFMTTFIFGIIKERRVAARLVPNTHSIVGTLRMGDLIACVIRECRKRHHEAIASVEKLLDEADCHVLEAKAAEMACAPPLDSLLHRVVACRLKQGELEVRDAKRRRKLAKKKKVLIKRDGEIQALCTEAQKKDDVIKSLRGEVKALRKGKDGEIDTLRGEINVLETSVGKKNSEIESLQSHSNTLQAELSALNQAIAAKDEKIQQLNAEQQSTETNNLRESHRAAVQVADSVCAELNAAKQKLTELEHELLTSVEAQRRAMQEAAILRSSMGGTDESHARELAAMVRAKDQAELLLKKKQMEIDHLCKRMKEEGTHMLAECQRLELRNKQLEEDVRRKDQQMVLAGISL